MAEVEELREYLAGLLDRFEAQPQALERGVSSLAAERLHRPLEPGGWTGHQVLAHTVVVDEQALLPRLGRILEEDKPMLPDWDGEAWMETDYDAGVPAEELLTRFRVGRQTAADRLRSVDDPAWNRTGLHPLRGERTLLWWLEYSVGHASEHLEQLSKAAGGN